MIQLPIQSVKKKGSINKKGKSQIKENKNKNKIKQNLEA